MKIRLLLSLICLHLFTIEATAQWQQLSGPGNGGNVDYVQATDSVVYASSSGLFQSMNRGGSWSRMVSPGVVHGIIHLQSIYVIASEMGIIRSSDNGSHWVYADTGLPPRVAVFGIVHTDSALVIGTYSSGIFRSTDQGFSWVGATTGVTNSSIRAMVMSGSTIYAATTGGVLKSTDQGHTWNEINNALSFKATSALAASDSVIVLGTYGGGIFRTTNAGATWQLTDDPIPNENISAVVFCGGSVFASTQAGLLRSTDMGATWDIVDGSAAMYAQSLASDRDTLYIATLYGLLRYVAATNSWASVGVTISNMSSVRSIDNSLYVSGNNGSVFNSTDGGSTWTAQGMLLPRHTISQLLLRDSILYAASLGGVFLHTNSAGGWSNPDTMLLGLNVVSLEATDSFLFAGTDNDGVYRSSDHGMHWLQSSEDLAGIRIRSLNTIGNTIFANRADSGLYRSTDFGLSWEQVNANSSLTPYAIVVAGSTLIVSSLPNRIYRSQDLGNTWTSTTTPTTSVCMMFSAEGNRVFGLTYANELVYSSDLGQSWVSCEGLNRYIQAMAIHRSALYFATDLGVWMRPLSELGVPVMPQEKTHAVSVAPNPTPGMLTLSNLPTGIERIQITNTLGVPVGSFTIQHKESFVLDLSAYPSGAYYLQLFGAGQHCSVMVVKE